MAKERERDKEEESVRKSESREIESDGGRGREEAESTGRPRPVERERERLTRVGQLSSSTASTTATIRTAMSGPLFQLHNNNCRGAFTPLPALRINAEATAADTAQPEAAEGRLQNCKQLQDCRGSGAPINP